MKENIICKPNPAKTLAVSAAPLRELLNFLIYNLRRELLIHCGVVKDYPVFEQSSEVFMNSVGSLAVKENAAYTVLRDDFGRRDRREFYNWERKNKHRIYLNLEEKNKDIPVRDKFAACPGAPKKTGCRAIRMMVRNWSGYGSYNLESMKKLRPIMK